MIATYLSPSHNIKGNALWSDSYIYPKKDLLDRISSLRSLGYEILLFPEGDGFNFSHPSLTGDRMFYDISNSFPWIKFLRKQEINEESLIEYLKNEVIVILPVSRLRIDSPFLSNYLCLFPEGYFDVENLNVSNLDGTKFEEFDVEKFSGNLRDILNHTTEVKLQAYSEYPLAVYKVNLLEYSKFCEMSHNDDAKLLKKVIDETNLFFDFIRFYENDYIVIDKVINRPGIIDNNYSTAIVHFIGMNVTHLISRDIESKKLIKGLGLHLENFDSRYNNPLFYNNTGEVGHILRYALRLNSIIVETDDKTLKFTQIMTLFEFLADPNNFSQSKKLKGKIAVFNAEDKTSYHNFCNRYKVLSENYRTEIIHNGKRIEDILETEAELNALFIELHRYVNNVLNAMLKDVFLSWNDFVIQRDAKQVSLI